ncbi:MAG: 50S ribosomal protein L4 [Acidobacteriota bacterium]
MNVSVINAAKEPQREVSLPDEVFTAEYRRDLVYEAVRSFLANQRLGTHSTKRRDEVAGSGKKLWKQKHTGRARMGEIRSPLWYHGGIVFGPKPRDYSFSVPRKVRRSAMRSLLSERLRRGLLSVVEDLSVESPKTKAFTQKYAAILDPHKTVLFVDEQVSDTVRLASRNLPGVKVAPVGEVSVYDLARYEMAVFTEKALLKLTEVLRP